MKRIHLLAPTALVAALALVATSLAGCTGSGPGDTAPPTSNPPAQKGEKTVQYTCSMHPEVVQDKPGDCPKCGMKLVEKR